MIGELPNVPPNTLFDSRRLAHDAGAHRPLQAGICGTGNTGTESIVVSGGYKDDEDHGSVIIYTGHGGRDSSGNQVSAQDLEDSGNAALVTSHLEGLPFVSSAAPQSLGRSRGGTPAPARFADSRSPCRAASTAKERTFRL
ncbi:YDG/SRA domain-containing protein [Streptomyces sp. NPDC047002]|uniref:YDG/SRA domain-containing protein n=1 Tax=Streptomyces sp. NPDC047002 TaxID=3155475 RepID=UPI0034533CFD